MNVSSLFSSGSNNRRQRGDKSEDDDDDNTDQEEDEDEDEDDRRAERAAKRRNKNKNKESNNDGNELEENNQKDEIESLFSRKSVTSSPARDRVRHSWLERAKRSLLMMNSSNIAEEEDNDDDPFSPTTSAAKKRKQYKRPQSEKEFTLLFEARNELEMLQEYYNCFVSSPKLNNSNSTMPIMNRDILLSLITEGCAALCLRFNILPLVDMASVPRSVVFKRKKLMMKERRLSSIIVDDNMMMSNNRNNHNYNDDIDNAMLNSQTTMKMSQTTSTTADSSLSLMMFSSSSQLSLSKLNSPRHGQGSGSGAVAAAASTSSSGGAAGGMAPPSFVSSPLLNMNSPTNNNNKNNNRVVVASSPLVTIADDAEQQHHNKNKRKHQKLEWVQCSQNDHKNNEDNDESPILLFPPTTKTTTSDTISSTRNIIRETLFPFSSTSAASSPDNTVVVFSPVELTIAFLLQFAPQLVSEFSILPHQHCSENEKRERELGGLHRVRYCEQNISTEQFYSRRNEKSSSSSMMNNESSTRWWNEIIVDDWIEARKNSNNNNHSYYGLHLLRKAIIKIMGSYENACVSGDCLDLLEGFSGAVADRRLEDQLLAARDEKLNSNSDIVITSFFEKFYSEFHSDDDSVRPLFLVATPSKPNDGAGVDENENENEDDNIFDFPDNLWFNVCDIICDDNNNNYFIQLQHPYDDHFTRPEPTISQDPRDKKFFSHDEQQQQQEAGKFWMTAMEFINSFDAIGSIDLRQRLVYQKEFRARGRFESGFPSVAFEVSFLEDDEDVNENNNNTNKNNSNSTSGLVLVPTPPTTMPPPQASSSSPLLNRRRRSFVDTREEKVELVIGLSQQQQQKQKQKQDHSSSSFSPITLRVFSLIDKHSSPPIFGVRDENQHDYKFQKRSSSPRFANDHHDDEEEEEEEDDNSLIFATRQSISQKCFLSNRYGPHLIVPLTNIDEDEDEEDDEKDNLGFHHHQRKNKTLEKEEDKDNDVEDEEDENDEDDDDPSTFDYVLWCAIKTSSSSSSSPTPKIKIKLVELDPDLDVFDLFDEFEVHPKQLAPIKTITQSIIGTTTNTNDNNNNRIINCIASEWTPPSTSSRKESDDHDQKNEQETFQHIPSSTPFIKVLPDSSSSSSTSSLTEIVSRARRTLGAVGNNVVLEGIVNGCIDGSSSQHQHHRQPLGMIDVLFDVLSPDMLPLRSHLLSLSTTASTTSMMNENNNSSFSSMPQIHWLRPSMLNLYDDDGNNDISGKQQLAHVASLTSVMKNEVAFGNDDGSSSGAFASNSSFHHSHSDQQQQQQQRALIVLYTSLPNTKTIKNSNSNSQNHQATLFSNTDICTDVVVTAILFSSPSSENNNNSTALHFIEQLFGLERKHYQQKQQEDVAVVSSDNMSSIIKINRDQSFIRFRFLQNGWWHEFLVDTWLPYCYYYQQNNNNNENSSSIKPAFVSSSSSLLWVQLLQKAFAKICGSYRSLFAVSANIVTMMMNSSSSNNNMKQSGKNNKNKKTSTRTMPRHQNNFFFSPMKALTTSLGIDSQNVVELKRGRAGRPSISSFHHLLFGLFVASSSDDDETTMIIKENVICIALIVKRSQQHHHQTFAIHKITTTSSTPPKRKRRDSSTSSGDDDQDEQNHFYATSDDENNHRVRISTVSLSSWNENNNSNQKGIEMTFEEFANECELCYAILKPSSSITKSLIKSTNTKKHHQHHHHERLLTTRIMYAPNSHDFLVRKQKFSNDDSKNNNTDAFIKQQLRSLQPVSCLSISVLQFPEAESDEKFDNISFLFTISTCPSTTGSFDDNDEYSSQQQQQQLCCSKKEIQVFKRDKYKLSSCQRCPSVFQQQQSSASTPSSVFDDELESIFFEDEEGLPLKNRFSFLASPPSPSCSTKKKEEEEVLEKYLAIINHHPESCKLGGCVVKIEVDVVFENNVMDDEEEERKLLHRSRLQSLLKEGKLFRINYFEMASSKSFVPSQWTLKSPAPVVISTTTSEPSAAVASSSSSSSAPNIYECIKPTQTSFNDEEENQVQLKVDEWPKWMKK